MKELNYENLSGFIFMICSLRILSISLSIYISVYKLLNFVCMCNTTLIIISQSRWSLFHHIVFKLCTFENEADKNCLYIHRSDTVTSNHEAFLQDFLVNLKHSLQN